ncbi:DUF982 domain-containing protein [Mesorhizobium sp.]|uniref:DUF982 domain-containing protein n=1 Tax=Mesorhizobium sp. TaxID=1871066 RepID=UPI0025C2BB67|nr:DUF982 domain-containing protein [Mesorhizobium sp.]
MSRPARRIADRKNSSEHYRRWMVNARVRQSVPDLHPSGALPAPLPDQKTTIRTEDVMNDVWFSEPVVIDFEPSVQHKVSSCFEAIECLDQRWPRRARDRAWRSANRVCRDALDGLRSPVEARKTLRKAAKAAGLLG